jgi:hypothetical protein
MSPGKRYLNLLRIEYEDLIRAAEFDVNHVWDLLSRYVYAPAEFSEFMRKIGQAKSDIEYYRKKLQELGGAENGSPNPTESKKDSESPMPGFKGVSCTTVM